MSTNEDNLTALWKQNWRHARLRIGDRVIVRFSSGTVSVGTVIPAEGQTAAVGDRPRRGGLWVRLDDGREWVAADTSTGHVRRIGTGGAE